LLNLPQIKKHYDKTGAITMRNEKGLQPKTDFGTASTPVTAKGEKPALEKLLTPEFMAKMKRLSEKTARALNYKDPDEILGRTLETICKNYDSFNGANQTKSWEENFHAWAYRVMRNRSSHIVEEETRGKRDANKTASLEEEEKYLQKADHTQDPLEILAARESAEMSDQLLAGLKEEERVVFAERTFNNAPRGILASQFSMEITGIDRHSRKAKTALLKAMAADFRKQTSLPVKRTAQDGPFIRAHTAMFG
jgi:RNA polymerase sigma factor (sigma-70 family)